MASQTIPIEPIPNQQLTSLLGGNRYSITIKAVGQGVAVSIVMNNETLCEGIRAVAGAPIIPYPYAENGGGNFMLTTLNNVIPAWADFANTCFLVWTDPVEMETYRAGI